MATKHPRHIVNSPCDKRETQNRHLLAGACFAEPERMTTVQGIVTEPDQRPVFGFISMSCHTGLLQYPYTQGSSSTASQYFHPHP